MISQKCMNIINNVRECNMWWLAYLQILIWYNESNNQIPTKQSTLNMYTVEGLDKDGTLIIVYYMAQ